MRFVKIFILLTLMLSATGVFAQSSDEKETKKRLQNKYVEFLKTEGYSPVVDEDGDIEFKWEGKTYYVLPYGSDPEYFVIGRYLRNDDKDTGLKIYRAMHDASKTYKVVKIWMNDSYAGVWIRTEEYLPKEDDFKEVFYRCIRNVRDAEDLFKKIYNE